MNKYNIGTGIVVVMLILFILPALIPRPAIETLNKQEIANFRDGFMEECDEGEDTAYCMCVCNELLDNYTERKIVMLTLKEEIPDDFYEIAYACTNLN